MPIWSFFFLYTSAPASLKSWAYPCVCLAIRDPLINSYACGCNGNGVAA